MHEPIHAQQKEPGQGGGGRGRREGGEGGGKRGGKRGGGVLLSDLVRWEVVEWMKSTADYWDLARDHTLHCSLAVAVPGSRFSLRCQFHSTGGLRNKYLLRCTLSQLYYPIPSGHMCMCIRRRIYYRL